MGKSIELLGLAAFNVFLAMILSVTFLSGAEEAGVNKLTEERVKNFIHEVSAISNGERNDMDSFAITEFFMKHIADDSLFRSTVRFDTSGNSSGSSGARELEIDKMSYISQTLKGLHQMNRHETEVVIDFVEIQEDGQKAIVITTNYERGLMPVDDGFGDVKTVPVTGTSYCEQTLVLKTGNIQMAGAKCMTDLQFAEAF